MERGMMKAVLATLLCVMVLACQVRGDECRDAVQDCRWNVTTATVKVTDFFHEDPPNITAIISQCQAAQQVMNACVRTAQSVCPASFDIDDAMESAQITYNSACGPNTICSFQLQQCSLSHSTVTQITSAMRQDPPNTELITNMCRNINTTLSPCVEKLKTDCSAVSELSEAITSITASFESLCGRVPLCQIQMARCQTHFREIASAQGEERIKLICRVRGDISRCLSQEMDAECRSLPEIKPVLQAINSTITAHFCSEDSMQCPQAWQCLARPSDENSENCSWPGGLVGCLADLKGVCALKEDAITFKEVDTLSMQFCQEIKNADGEERNCTKLGQCVLNSDLIKQMRVGQLSSVSQIQISALLDSRTWCKYLETVAGCHGQSADSCRLDPSLGVYMKRQHERLKVVCASKGVVTAVGGWMLALLAATFATWVRSFL